jgi:hypothetical protein
MNTKDQTLLTRARAYSRFGTMLRSFITVVDAQYNSALMNLIYPDFIPDYAKEYLRVNQSVIDATFVECSEAMADVFRMIESGNFEGVDAVINSATAKFDVLNSHIKNIGPDSFNGQDASL